DARGCRSDVDAPRGEQCGRADDDTPLGAIDVERAFDAEAGHGPELTDRAAAEAIGPRSGRDRLACRMLAARLERAGEVDDHRRVEAPRRHDRTDARRPLGERARLVEYDRVDSVGGLE